MTTIATRRRQTPLYVLTLLHAGAFAVALLLTVREPGSEGWVAQSVHWSRLSIEILAGFYVFSILLKCLDHLGPGGDPVAPPEALPGPAPRVAVIYLCAGDLDARAVESLCRLEHEALTLFVHDDSTTPEAQQQVDELVRRLEHRTGADIRLLRRGSRTGGKPGAVNYVLEHVYGHFPYFLLCDNDSIALDPDALARALPRLQADEQIAAVQMRNEAVDSPGDSSLNRTLARAIDVFDLFARHQDRHGMMPFLGHNALLRTSAVQSVGGFRPGCFADDIDMTVRLALRGWRVAYAPDIRFGETHPADYGSFRRRAFKWAFGCGQILRHHTLDILRSRRMTLTQKLGFLEFSGFYAVQLLLIAYLVLTWIVGPWVSEQAGGVQVHGQAGSALIVLAIFLPVLCSSWKRGELRRVWPFAWICCLVYGSTAFVTARGVVAGLRDRPRIWVPTNAAGQRGPARAALLAELFFGIALLAVPALRWPDRVLEPALYLFASVFVLVPVVALTYGAPRPPRTARFRFRVQSATALCVILPVLVLSVSATFLPPAPVLASADRGRVELRNGSFFVDGDELLVRGIHYGPWRPGTGPGKGYPYPSDAELEEDLRLIAGLGANTILVHDAPPRLLDRAAEHGLLVLAAYYINWQSIADDTLFESRAVEIEELARPIATHPSLLGILLGNEVVQWVRDEVGNEFLEERLASLALRVREAAPNVALSHCNWPITRDLDLSFFDFVAFNLYPSWPREVVVRGYGEYIREMLVPLTEGRPLVITEFGQNTLEASELRQGEILAECWEAIRQHTAGGVAFAFADEWWKNYDNPIDAGDFWQREHAPDDELTHDLDPEEHYGIFTATRTPKPAAAVVKAMYSRDEPRSYAWLPFAPLLGIFAYSVWVLRPRRRSLERQRDEVHDSIALTTRK